MLRPLHSGIGVSTQQDQHKYGFKEHYSHHIEYSIVDHMA